MNKELYVSTTPHETKVALVEDDSLAEVYFERENEYTLAGSIYKGRVTRVLPGMQSAFVDIGLERDAFLYVSDFLELQDEEEDGEFGDVKVTGSTLAQANGLIVTEPEAEEESLEEGAAEGASAESTPASSESREAAPRWRGRRRRRGRRGGRDRMQGQNENGVSTAAPQGEEAAGEEFEEVSSEAENEGAREPQRRELRGFEPRGLAMHGLARTPDAEQTEEFESEEQEEQPAQAAPAAHSPMVLPGESISKYNRSEGEAPAAESTSEEPERTDRDRERGRRDRFGRRRGGERDRGERDRSRGREREPREYESTPLPENYTPIVLPGESISKYRGVEPVDAPVAALGADEAELHTEAPAEPAAPAHKEDEPLASASYSGAAGLPSLRHAPELEEEQKETVQEVVEASTEPAAVVHEETIEEETVEATHEEAAPVEAPAHPHLPDAGRYGAPAQSPAEEPAHAESVSAPSEEAAQLPEAEGEGSDLYTESGGGRRTWRNRISKIFGGSEERQSHVDESQAITPAEEGEALAAVHPEMSDEVEPEHRPGSFVIEGGHVEHEELDEEEAEMPALAAHRDRYEDDEEVENGNGQLSEAVRESDEESELEDEEYDFGGEEFEESEMLAGAAAEAEAEEEEEGEGEESEAAAAPSRRPERFERRDRHGRRGAPGRGRPRPRQQSRALPLISELLKEGQEILVQIAKEPIGKKGARITSHIALPGRFLVYMPTVNHVGVSRKISSDDERQRLKRIVTSERENGHGGFIVRTAAANIKEDELRADIRFLKHLWTEIRTRAEGSKSPALIYHDLNLVERILRDQVTSDFSQIWVDNESEYERVVRFASRFQPNLVRRIKLYTKETPLYEQFGINDEINKSLKSKVWLKSGGYIVINQTEALVAIDINTGKYVGKTARLEDTIVKTNIDAVKEIVRQIRLRDLGGIIVVDFIDMDERKNRQKVMQALEEAMKSDRAPSKILQFNDFGLVAITRKRVKQSLERTLGTPCPYCEATGFVKSVQTVCNEIYVEMRKVRRHVENKEVILRVNPEVAKELKNDNARWLQEMEDLLRHPVLVKSDPLLHQEQFDMNY
jgi:ribonuclease G